MSIPGVVRIIGVLLFATALAMAPSLVFGIGEGLLLPWVGSILTTASLGAGCFFSTSRHAVLDQRGGLLVVGLGWLAVVSAGSLPFIFTGVETDLAKAFFESTSGFTTTGATVFAAIEPLPDSILLWRSVSHWLGGMGIIVLGVAILPFLGVGGAQLFRAEAPGISTDRLTPRIASTARLLWGVYAGFTLLLGIVYVLLGMSVFDAVNHAMSTLATGGFSTRTASMAAFSPAVQWITVLFMFIAGVNFALHYRMIAGRWSAWARDIEWQVYFLLAAGAALVCFGSLVGTGYTSLEQTLRDAVFNVVAVHSTTGFATTDFAAWPVLCQVILIGLMFVGAMGGSTGGGLKVVRAIVLAKHTVANFRLVIHPRAVIVHRLGGKPIGEDILLNIVGFFALYITTHAVGTLLLAAMGYDFLTAASAAIAAMSSIGPGLGLVGPASHYGDLLPGAHLVLSALMLLGRLEFYTLLMLFIPETWKLAAKGTR